MCQLKSPRLIVAGTALVGHGKVREFLLFCFLWQPCNRSPLQYFAMQHNQVLMLCGKIINDLCQEVLELKVEISFFSLLRCSSTSSTKVRQIDFR